MTHSFLFLQPYALLIFQKQRMPRLLHVQVSASHFELMLGLNESESVFREERKSKSEFVAIWLQPCTMPDDYDESEPLNGNTNILPTWVFHMLHRFCSFPSGILDLLVPSMHSLVRRSPKASPTVSSIQESTYFSISEWRLSL
jgi:hypothetical protein